MGLIDTQQRQSLKLPKFRHRRRVKTKRAETLGSWQRKHLVKRLREVKRGQVANQSQKQGKSQRPNQGKIKIEQFIENLGQLPKN